MLRSSKRRKAQVGPKTLPESPITEKTRVSTTTEKTQVPGTTENPRVSISTTTENTRVSSTTENTRVSAITETPRVSATTENTRVSMRRRRRRISPGSDEEDREATVERELPPSLPAVRKWVVITIYCADLDKEVSPDRLTNNIEEVFLKAFGRSSSIPKKITSSFLPCIVAKVKQISRNDNGPLLVEVLSYRPNPSQLWRVTTSKVIRQCIRISIQIGDIILIYGGEMDYASMRLRIVPRTNDLYVLKHIRNGHLDKVVDGDLKDKLNSVQDDDDDENLSEPIILNQVEYPYTSLNSATTSESTSSTILMIYQSFQGVTINAEDSANYNGNQKSASVNRGSQWTSSAKPDANQNEIPSPIANECNQLVTRDFMEGLRSTPISSSSRVRSSTPIVNKIPGPLVEEGSGTDNAHGVQIIEDPNNATWESFAGFAELNEMENEINNMDYDDWISRNLFIPGDCRPTVKKAGKEYIYKKLKTLDDELQTEIKREALSNKKPTLMLKEHQYLYGIIVQILSTNEHRMQNPSYRCRISDNSMSGVILRLHTSNMESQKGPPLKVGQVVRVHRATVQSEYDENNSTHRMAVSTCPHRNYVLFNWDEDSTNILYQTIAKNITLTASDTRLIYELLTATTSSELTNV